jgi:hypothetical protein
MEARTIQIISRKITTCGTVKIISNFIFIPSPATFDNHGLGGKTILGPPPQTYTFKYYIF